MLETILKYFSTTNSARHFQHDNLSTIQFQTAVPRAENQIACYTWSMHSSTRTISARGQSQTATAFNCSKIHWEIDIGATKSYTFIILIYFSIKPPESGKIQDLVARMSMSQYILL
jgi:hypothetical protein